MKYVNITDEAVVLTLSYAKYYGPLRCIRERAHGLLLSNRGFTLQQIAEILEIKCQTISQWIYDWEDYGIRALYKNHGGGNPCIYNESEVIRIKELVAEECRRLSYVKSKIEKETGKLSSIFTLANIVKKLGLVYKRLRK
ncbi:helix-turn-helix domain-containing protein, partial [Endozoicomonas sp.]|nr:helix-turn-helix domain-containing protein [Endozoicomonas sp.]